MPSSAPSRPPSLLMPAGRVPTTVGAGRTVPARAFLLSLLALAVPVVQATLAPQVFGQELGLIPWLPALVPAFLLAYYKGWHGAALALAGGMATISLVQVELIVLELPTPPTGVVIGVVALLITVALGSGWMAELLLRAREEAEEAAYTDPLTGLANRRHARVVLDIAWAAALRGDDLSVVLFDLDRFKEVNDNQGHGEGDRVLQVFADVLADRTRRMDLSARFGGEEFISILIGCSTDRALAFAEDVRRQFGDQAFDWGEVTVSAGVAAAEPAMGTPDVLLAAADRALYLAKEAGRNQVRTGEDHLPRPVRRTRPPEAPDAPGRPLREIRILLVDDDPATLSSTGRLLERLGSSVEAARSPRDALERITGGEPFDLLITDIVMPEMSGFTLVELASRVLPDLPVIYASGYAQEEVYWGGTPGAQSAFLSKPMELGDLTATIQRLVTHRDGPSSAITAAPMSSTPSSGDNGLGSPFDRCILVVDDDPAVVRSIVRLLRRSGYSDPMGITDPTRVTDVLIEHDVDLVVLDLAMPVMDGFKVMAEISRVVEPREYLPILVLTGDTDIETRRRALAAGAMDFLGKPFDAAEALARVRNLIATRGLTQRVASERDNLERLVLARSAELADAKTEILHRLARAAEYRDDVTGRHAERVGLMASLIASELEMPLRRVDLIRRTAPLHDVGKIGVSDSVLKKPGRLTDEEFAAIQQHTLIGEQILGHSRHEILQVASRIAVGHHERWDGTGYPHGLRGGEIPIEARIVTVADVFDVISHARPYKDPMSPRDAVDELRRCAGEQFDPKVVEAFCSIYDRAGIDGIHAIADPIDPESDTGVLTRSDVG